MRNIPLVILASFALAILITHKACEQEAQLDRIEEAAGSCNVSAAACPPVDTTNVTPAAPANNKVKRFLCRQDLRRLHFGNTTEFVGDTTCTENPRALRVLDPVFTSASLANAQVCNVLTSQTCEERFPDGPPSCRLANTPLKFLCGCRGSGVYRAANGHRELQGFFRDFRILPNPDCAGSNGCAVQLEMEANQWWALEQVREDLDGQKYPADRIRAIAELMHLDTERGKNRASLPACLRPHVPVRQGRKDIDAADEDTDETDGGI